jgi:RimJ/RimL family protein N-acetyltransferase
VEGEREVGYWLGREYWGKGIATAALAAYLKVEQQRPLHAYVAAHNIGSRRVLEKCGFTVQSTGNIAADGIEETILILR